MGNLVTFGDSWPAGAELTHDEVTFGHIIANMLGMNFENYSRPATSVEHMILQLHDYLHKFPNVPTTAIFFLTDFSRSLYFLNNSVTEMSVQRGPEIYYKEIYTDKLGVFKVNASVLALQRMCQMHNIKDYYVFGWIKAPLYLSGIDCNKFFSQGQKSCADMLEIPNMDVNNIDNFYHVDNYYFRPKICHPNQLGHQVIAENLTNWITKNEQNQSQ